MNDQTTRDMPRHICRLCVRDGHPTCAGDDVPPERRYQKKIFPPAIDHGYTRFL